MSGSGANSSFQRWRGLLVLSHCVGTLPLWPGFGGPVGISRQQERHGRTFHSARAEVTRAATDPQVLLAPVRAPLPHPEDRQQWEAFVCGLSILPESIG